MSCCNFMTFSEPIITVTGKLWLHTAMHLFILSADITEHLLCVRTIPGAEDAEIKSFFLLSL